MAERVLYSEYRGNNMVTKPDTTKFLDNVFKVKFTGTDGNGYVKYVDNSKEKPATIVFRSDASPQEKSSKMSDLRYSVDNTLSSVLVPAIFTMGGILWMGIGFAEKGLRYIGVLGALAVASSIYFGRKAYKNSENDLDTLGKFNKNGIAK